MSDMTAVWLVLGAIFVIACLIALVSNTNRSNSKPDTDAWPEGVIARYLTPAGGTIDLYRDDSGGVGGSCTGCGKDVSGVNGPDVEPTAREMAQQHADACRAAPKPA